MEIREMGGVNYLFFSNHYIYDDGTLRHQSSVLTFEMLQKAIDRMAKQGLRGYY